MSNFAALSSRSAIMPCLAACLPKSPMRFHGLTKFALVRSWVSPQAPASFPATLRTHYPEAPILVALFAVPGSKEQAPQRSPSRARAQGAGPRGFGRGGRGRNPHALSPKLCYPWSAAAVLRTEILFDSIRILLLRLKSLKMQATPRIPPEGS